MENKQPEIDSVIIPFEQLGEQLARENHWTGSFSTGIGGADPVNQFTVERENFGDADSPMLTHVLSDKGMRTVAAILGSWHSRTFTEHAGEFDGDVDAFIGSSYGEKVWCDYERVVHGFVPYLDELDVTRFRPGDRVFDIDKTRYGTVASVGKDSVLLDDGTPVDPLFLLKASDNIFHKPDAK